MAGEWIDNQVRPGRSIANIKRIFEGLPYWLLLFSVIIPSISFGVGSYAGMETSPDNARFILSTLAGAQASVLAIVFSVTVIGIQLVATRYSPRMISLFVNSPILFFTFLIFVISIGIDIALLFNTPVRISSIYTAGIYTAIGFSILTALSLLAFVRSAIRQSTPEGAVSAFVDDLTSEKYLDRTKLALEEDLKNVHPLQPLFTMIMEALSNRRRATADMALRNYGNLASSTLKRFIDEGTFDEVDSPVGTALFEPVLEEHLRDIALHAEEQDESQLVGDAIDWMLELGTSGLRLDEPTVARQAVMGLEWTILRASIDSGQYIANDNSWMALGKLLNEAAQYPRPRVVWNAASTVMHRTNQVMWRAHDANRFRHSMTRLYGNMGTAHEHLLDHYGIELASVEIDWQEDHIPDDTPNRREIEAVDRLRKAFFQSSGAFLGYIDEEGEYPITEGNFKDAWKKICVDASTSPAKDYAVSLCQSLIEICFIIGSVKPDDEFWWMDSLARVKFEGDPEIVERAFDRILEFEPQEEDPGLWLGVDREDRRTRFYWNQISIEGFRPLNTHPEFPDRIDSLKKQVNRRWNELEEL